MASRRMKIKDSLWNSVTRLGLLGAAYVIQASKSVPMWPALILILGASSRSSWSNNPFQKTNILAQSSCSQESGLSLRPPLIFLTMLLSLPFPFLHPLSYLGCISSSISFPLSLDLQSFDRHCSSFCKYILSRSGGL